MEDRGDARPYFAYGTLLGLTHMRERYPSAKVLAHAVYPDHELDFWRYADGADGGCTIVDRAGRDLLGVLYELDPEDRARLLAVDGYADSYEVRDIEAVTDTGERIAAFTLRVDPDGGTWPPPAPYAQLVTDGAREADLPDGYQARLREIISAAQGSTRANPSEPAKE